MDVTLAGALIGGGATLVAAFGAEYYRRHGKARGDSSRFSSRDITSATGVINAKSGSDVTIVQGKGNVVNPREDRDSELELVRVDVHPGSEDDPFPVLDITARNRGTVSAVIHELVIRDVEVWAFRPGLRPSALPVSWRYDVDLGGDQRRVHRVSQAVGGGEADRFEVRLGTSEPIYPFVGHFLYLFHAALVIDANRHELPLGSFLVRLPQPMQLQGSFNAGLDEHELRDLETRARKLALRVATEVTVQAEALQALDELQSLTSNPTTGLRGG